MIKHTQTHQHKQTATISNKDIIRRQKEKEQTNPTNNNNKNKKQIETFEFSLEID